MSMPERIVLRSTGPDLLQPDELLNLIHADADQKRVGEVRQGSGEIVGRVLTADVLPSNERFRREYEAQCGVRLEENEGEDEEVFEFTGYPTGVDDGFFVFTVRPIECVIHEPRAGSEQESISPDDEGKTGAGGWRGR